MESANLTTPIRVLHIVHSLTYGGIETYVLNVLRHTNHSLVRCDVCAVGRERGSLVQEAEQLGARVLSCPLRRNVLGLPMQVRRPYAFVRELTTLLRRETYEVVHSHVNFMNGLVMRAAYMAGVPVRIAHGYTVLDWSKLTPLGCLFPRWMRYWIDQYSTHKLGDSKPTMSNFHGIDWMHDPRCSLHYCGIDSVSFSEVAENRARVRRELGLFHSAPVVGHVGRFSEPKNHDFLLQVFAEFVTLHPDARLLLVGDGPLRATIEARAGEKGVGDCVLFVGSRFSVPQAMMAMDVFVFPSLYESLPLVVLEAQAAGLRCVVSDRVTEEVDVMAGGIRHLPLEAAPTLWAHVVDTLLAQGRLNATSVRMHFNSSQFSIRRSVAMLQEVYLANSLIRRTKADSDLMEELL